MTTLIDLLRPFGVAPIPGAEELEVPVLGGPQRQGDVFWFPATAPSAAGTPVPAAGLAVVSGETTGGNSHVLQPDAGCVVLWQSGPVWAGDGPVVLGWLTVPEGAAAWLVHTDEHGANGIAAGRYEFRGKREAGEEVRRVAD